MQCHLTKLSHYSITEFLDSRYMKVVTLSAQRTGSLYPPEYIHGNTLENESTPGTQCGRKDYVNEKF
jgi:hypothetical protein